MIQIIKRNEYYKLKKKRDRKQITGILLWDASKENGCYYMCNQSGMKGVREMSELQKKVKAETHEQLTIFDL